MHFSSLPENRRTEITLRLSVENHKTPRYRCILNRMKIKRRYLRCVTDKLITACMLDPATVHHPDSLSLYMYICISICKVVMQSHV